MFVSCTNILYAHVKYYYFKFIPTMYSALNENVVWFVYICDCLKQQLLLTLIGDDLTVPGVSQQVLVILPTNTLEMSTRLLTVTVSYDACVTSTRWSPGKCHYFVHISSHRIDKMLYQSLQRWFRPILPFQWLCIMSAL